MWNFLTSILLGSICLFVTYIWKRMNYFKDKNIFHETPFPILGNMGKVYTGKEHVSDLLGRLYHGSKDLYAGAFNFTQPVIVIKDLDLLKKIMIKDFDHFSDHMEFTDEQVDPLNGKSLFALRGERWKEMRVALSPAFTSSKMRGMMPLMEDRCDNFMNFLRKEVNEKGSGYTEMEMKDPYTRYANDVIASCGFGIEVDSFKDKDNIFYKMVRKLIDFESPIQLLKLGIFSMSPFIARMLNVKIMPKDASDFMTALVKSNIEERETKNIVRPDMIHLLMLAKQGKLNDEENPHGKQKVNINWTDEEVTAQVALFLFAGFENNSNMLSFMSHELAINPEIQDKLIAEVDETLEKHDGKIDYTTLFGMKYLDMVVNETLRKWPLLSSTDRICVKDYELPPPNEFSNEKYMLKKGDGVWIPSFNIHRDPDIFEEPEKFVPERFSDENKSKIHPCAYLVFGAGPRNCIGSRFALMEAKLLIVHILKEFKFVKSPKTLHPMKYKNSLFNYVPTTGHWVGIQNREK